MTDSQGKPPNSVTALPIKAIKLPAQQPRRYFDPGKLAQLTESVKHNGILENLLVRPLDDNQYELQVMWMNQFYEVVGFLDDWTRVILVGIEEGNQGVRCYAHPCELKKLVKS